MSTQWVPLAVAPFPALSGAVGKHSWDGGGSFACPHPAKDPARAVPALCRSRSRGRAWLGPQRGPISTPRCYPCPLFPQEWGWTPPRRRTPRCWRKCEYPVSPPGAPPLPAVPGLSLSQPCWGALLPAVPSQNLLRWGGMRNYLAPGRAGMSALVLGTAPLQAGVWQRVQAGSPCGAASLWLGQILFRAALAGTAGCRLAALPHSGARVLSTPPGLPTPPASLGSLGVLLHGPHRVGVQVGGCRVQLRAKCGGEGLCPLPALTLERCTRGPPHAGAMPVASPAPSPAACRAVGRARPRQMCRVNE